MTDYSKVPVTETDEKKTEIPDKYGYGIRHLQSFLFFTCLALGYMSRAHLGVTVVAMTNPLSKKVIANVHINSSIEGNLITPKDSTDNTKEVNENSVMTAINKTISTDVFGDYITEVNDTNSKPDMKKKKNSEDNNKSIWNVYRTYDWKKSTQEMLLGSFFLGYCIMMFPMGLVCQRWGGMIPLQIALFVNGIVSIAAPWLTAWGGWKMLAACRVMQGASQAGFYPGIHSLLAKWVPVNERGSLSGYVYTGSGLGTIVAFQTSGILAESTWGWPSIFWATGLLCLIGFMVLTVFGANSPAQHKAISQEEKSYIMGHSGDDNKNKSNTPWKKILTSRHVWACFSGHVGSGVSFVFLFTQVPTYMHIILGFNIKSSGLLSSLPYITAFGAAIAVGYLSDFCANRKILSIKSTRMINNTIGSFGPACCISIASFTTDSTLAVILIIMTLSAHVASHTGWMVNYIDLSPKYSGALMAFGNTLCNCMVVILPFVVTGVITDVTNPYQWRVMFLLIAGMLVLANLFYLLFMSTDVQSWNDANEVTKPEEILLEKNSETKL